MCIIFFTVCSALGAQWSQTDRCGAAALWELPVCLESLSFAFSGNEIESNFGNAESRHES